MKKVLFFAISISLVSLVACGGDGLTDVFLEAGFGGSSGSGSGSDSGSSSVACTCDSSDGLSTTYTETEMNGKSCDDLEEFINAAGYGYTVNCY